MPMTMSGHPSPSNTTSRTLAKMTEAERTRTALGPAAQWAGMYHDRPESDSGNAMAGLSVNDNRAKAGGAAGWGNPLGVERKRLEEKYVGSPIAGSNPTAWIENKSGVESDVMAGLLREKELGAPDPNNPEYAARVPASPFVKTRPSPLSQRLTLTERAEGKTRSRVGSAMSPVGAPDMDEFVEYIPGSTRGMPPATADTKPAAYYLQGTQRGYDVDEANRDQYWTMSNRPQGVGGAEVPQPAAIGLSAAPKAGIAAAQQLAFYEDARVKRVEELTAKLGIDKVKLNSGFVDTTPQAGHNTAAVPVQKQRAF